MLAKVVALQVMAVGQDTGRGETTFSIVSIIGYAYLGVLVEIIKKHNLCETYLIAGR